MNKEELIKLINSMEFDEIKTLELNYIINEKQCNMRWYEDDE